MSSARIIISFCWIVIFLTATPVLTLLLGPTITGWSYKALMFPAIIFLSLPFLKISNITEKLYVLIMLLAIVSHYCIKIEGGKEPFWESFEWISLIIMLSFCRNRIKIFSFCITIFFVFFFTECLLAIYEKFTETHILQWDSDIIDGFQRASISTQNFRATALLGHPLTNANVVSLFTAIIFSLKRIDPKFKYACVFLGLLSLWSFNCRGAILVWLVILSYRLFFYKRKFIYFIGFLSVIAILLPLLTLNLQDIDALGRLSGGIDDDSTLTRIESFVFFYEHHWNTTNILFGGDLIEMPGTNLLLENGILENLGYWGWIVGSLKILLEVIISYCAIIKKGNRTDVIVIMIAAWGVSFMNNNSFSPTILSFLMLSSFVYNNFNPIRLRRVKGKRKRLSCNNRRTLQGRHQPISNTNI